MSNDTLIKIGLMLVLAGFSAIAILLGLAFRLFPGHIAGITG
jgi:hypothetical protein